MEKMNLGLQMYTIRDYCATKPLFERSMRKVAEMGYKYYQFSGIADDATTPERLKELGEELGMECGLTHWEDKEILEDTQRVIEMHDIFGCDGIGIGGMPREFRNYEGYNRFIEKYSPAIEEIGKAGKTFCYHNHWFEFERYANGKTGMEMLLEGLPKSFKLTLDTAWAHRAGIDCAAFIRKYPDRIFATHIKDITIVNDELTVTEVLTGNMNFDSIFEACKEAGIKWHFVEQDWVTNMNLYDSAKLSHDNLKERYADYLQ